MLAFLLYTTLGIFLCLYTILSSILYGASLFLVFPDFLHNREKVYPLLHEVTEIPTVSMLLFLLVTWLYFPTLVSQFSIPLAWPISIAVIFLIIRYISSKCIYYGYTNTIIVRIVFFTSFLAPILLSYIYVYTILGAQDYPLHALTILFACLSILSTILISGTFFKFWEDKHDKDKTSRWMDTLIHEVFVYLMLFLLITPVILLKFASYMLGNILLDLLCFFIVLVVSIAFYQIHKRENYLRTFIYALLLWISVFLSLFFLHYPYVIFSNTIQDGMLSTSQSIPLYTFFIFLLTVSLGFSSWLYYRSVLGRKELSEVY